MTESNQTSQCLRPSSLCASHTQFSFKFTSLFTLLFRIWWNYLVTHFSYADTYLKFPFFNHGSSPHTQNSLWHRNMNILLSEACLLCFWKHSSEMYQEDNFNPRIHCLLMTFALVLENSRHVQKPSITIMKLHRSGTSAILSFQNDLNILLSR